MPYDAPAAPTQAEHQALADRVAALEAGTGSTPTGDGWQRPDPSLAGMSQDATAELRTLLLSGSRRVMLDAGVWRHTDTLHVDTGTMLYLAPGAVLVKDFAASGAARSAGIVNRDLAVKADDVWVYGPGEYSAASDAATGNMLSLHGDRIRLQDFTTREWNGGRHTVLAGDDCRAIGTRWYGGGGRVSNGGLRFEGGRGFIGYGLHIESGDDCFQFVPSGSPNDPLFDMDIIDSVYVGCSGASSDAKLMVMGLQNSAIPDGQIAMSASIRRSGFLGVTGHPAVASRIQNISSSGRIEDCFITDASVDMADAPADQGGAEFLVNGEPTTGGIHGLSVTRLRLANSQRQPVKMRGKSYDVAFDDCRLGPGEVELAGVRPKLRDCILRGVRLDTTSAVEPLLRDNTEL